MTRPTGPFHEVEHHTADWATTRPVVSGTQGVVTAGHPLVSMAGMRMLLSGGNAFDAAVAAGFVLHVAEPHLNGPGGEVPILFEIRPAIAVKLAIKDFDGVPTVGRFTFKDKAGHVFPAKAKRLAPDFFFQDQIYRPDGGTVLLGGVKRLREERREFGVPILANITEFGHTPLFTTPELGAAGVDIVLYCCGAYRAMNRGAETVYRVLLEAGHQRDVIGIMQTRAELYDYLDYHDFERKLDELFTASTGEDTEED